MKRHAMALPVTALAFLAAAACSENPVTVDRLAINASSVHLKGGANAEPSYIDIGLALAVSGELAGLGNGDVLVSMTGTANVTSTCTNQGGNAAPGQNPAPTTVAGSVAIPEAEIKNGTTPFSLSSVAPTTPIPGAPGCPNPTWTESIDDLAFTAGTITVEQPPGTVVLTIQCSFSSPTSDGSVSEGDITCS